jgi:hypothetical protein
VLTARPIVTVPLLASLTGANDAPLRLAVSRLEDAGILERAQGKYRRTAVWWAPEVLGLLQHAERRNASPAMDTTVAAPALPVPRPVDKLTVVCGHQMERTGATCTLNKGHKGRHRGTPRPDQTHG